MPPARRAPVVLKARVGRRDAKERNVAAIPKEEQEKEEKNITENEEIGRLLWAWGEDSRRRSGGESLSNSRSDSAKVEGRVVRPLIFLVAFSRLQLY